MLGEPVDTSFTTLHTSKRQSPVGYRSKSITENCCLDQPLCDLVIIHTRYRFATEQRPVNKDRKNTSRSPSNSTACPYLCFLDGPCGHSRRLAGVTAFADCARDIQSSMLAIEKSIDEALMDPDSRKPIYFGYPNIIFRMNFILADLYSSAQSTLYDFSQLNNYSILISRASQEQRSSIQAKPKLGTYWDTTRCLNTSVNIAMSYSFDARGPGSVTETARIRQYPRFEVPSPGLNTGDLKASTYEVLGTPFFLSRCLSKKSKLGRPGQRHRKAQTETRSKDRR